MSLKRALQAPIGVFDSGLGGLVVACALAQSFPQKDILYVGDGARMPYGNQTEDVLERYTRELVGFLQRNGAAVAVAACHSLSVGECIASGSLAAAYNMPIWDVASPMLHAIQGLSQDCVLGVLGTERTIQSGYYTERIALQRPDVLLKPRAMPGLAELVEKGVYNQADKQKVWHQELASLGRVDALALACTHYPIMQEAFLAYYLSDVVLVDGMGSLMKAVAKSLDGKDVLPAPRRIQCCFTAYNAHVQRTVDSLLGTQGVYTMEIPALGRR